MGTGLNLARQKEKKIEPERNPVFRLARRFIPTTPDYEGERFFVRREGRWRATPLLLVLFVIGPTDLVFALDSIPAVFAITLDPFIVYTSNAFAVLGLRALYFALAGLMRMFHHLHYGLAAVLAFVGIKMLLADFYEIPIVVALGVVGIILAASVVASVVWPRRIEPLPVGSASPSKPNPSEAPSTGKEEG